VSSAVSQARHCPDLPLPKNRAFVLKIGCRSSGTSSSARSLA
jgi:hypothetical protein